MKIIGLDFETYGAVDLRKHGLYRYVQDRTFRPLIAEAYGSLPMGSLAQSLDFVQNMQGSREDLHRLLRDEDIFVAAHNAPFEKAVLDWLGIHLPYRRFIDTAVIARIAGGGSHLEAAAPQLLNTGKVDFGKQLIKLFSIPGELQEKADDPHFNPEIVRMHPQEWTDFKYYCRVDSKLSHDLASRFLSALTTVELDFAAVTAEMNEAGWHVDMALVEEMQRRYLKNLRNHEQLFRARTGAKDLNLNSHKQLVKWCGERGIKAKSFDERNVARMHKAISKKVLVMPPGARQVGYMEVLDLLSTKQELGGSSLKKLQTIKDLVVPNQHGEWRLKDQYSHAGAGQSLRTSGKGVQMQNLKRLDESNIGDMLELLERTAWWTNDELASNIRQVFTSRHKLGAIIVGDFKSVESRGLAWAAGEDWKLKAYKDNKDVYMMQAAKIFNVHYDDVLKPQRQTGKVGELSCGYGAGDEAVQGFAEKMGVEMSLGEAGKLVVDWRQTNPNTVSFWWELDDMMHNVIERGVERYKTLPDGLSLKLNREPAPASLSTQCGKNMHSLVLTVTTHTGQVLFRRFFHGVHLLGRNIRYFKPSDRKTGDLWRNSYTDPKTKQLRNYELYGGKLTGIFIQSLCRELFMRSLVILHTAVKNVPNVEIVGQFHDEIDMDWWPSTQPGALLLEEAEAIMGRAMSDSTFAPSFPLEADIKHAYRYIK